MITKQHETPSARWVRKQLELRSIPFFRPLTVKQSEKGSLQETWGLAWYATDMRGVEVAGSPYSIAELKRARGVIAQWPGYGIVKLLPG